MKTIYDNSKSFTQNQKIKPSNKNIKHSTLKPYIQPTPHWKSKIPDNLKPLKHEDLKNENQTQSTSTKPKTMMPKTAN